MINLTFSLEVFTRPWPWEGNLAEHGGLTVLRRQRSEFRELMQPGFAEQNTGEEGAKPRKSFRKLHRSLLESSAKY